MNPPASDNRKLYGIFCILACVAALAVEIMTVKSFVDALGVKSWPTAEGTILRSDLEEMAAPRRFTAHIEYEFTVDGESYQSTSVRTRGTGTKYRSDAMDVVARFPAGSQCTVYYQEGLSGTAIGNS